MLMNVLKIFVLGNILKKIRKKIANFFYTFIYIFSIKVVSNFF